VIPMYALGFDEWALKAYILYIYIHSTLIHANVRFDFHWLKHVIRDARSSTTGTTASRRRPIDVIRRPVPLARPPVRHLLPARQMAERLRRRRPSGAAGLLKQLTYPFRPA